MTKKDAAEPDVKRRRKGARTVDSSSPNVAESLPSKGSKYVWSISTLALLF